MAAKMRCWSFCTKFCTHYFYYKRIICATYFPKVAANMAAIGKNLEHCVGPRCVSSFSNNTIPLCLISQFQSVSLAANTEIHLFVAGYSEPFFRLNDMIGHLDVIVSLAHSAVCATIPYCRPKMLPQGTPGYTSVGVHPYTGYRHVLVFPQRTFTPGISF